MLALGRQSARFVGWGSAVLVASLVITGCASSGHPPSTASATTVSTTVAPAVTTTVAPPTTSSTSVTATPVDLRVYFLRTDHLGVAHRRVPATTTTATAAVAQLLAGPTLAEAAAGLTSDIPTGTRLLGISIAGGTATVDLTGAFASGGGSLSMAARLAQVTFTLTQFPSVSGVLFDLDGRPVTVFGGEGIILDHPSTRASFESLAPAILVETPGPGDQVTSPIRVSGSANVFEAAFQVQLTDPSGRVIGDRQIMASSGSGTRGTFEASLPYGTGDAGPGLLTVFDLSAKDGSRQDVVTIPIVLAAP